MEKKINFKIENTKDFSRFKDEIEALINNNEGLVFHEIEFNRIIAELHNTDLSYLIAFKSQVLVGFCPIHLIDKKATLRKFRSPLYNKEIPYAGWVVDRQKTNINEILGHLSIRYNESLSIRLNPFDFNSIENLSNRKKQVKYTAYIDFRKYLSADEVMANSLSKNTRHNVRRASKKGITIIELKKDRLGVFKELNETLKKEKHLVNRGMDHLDELYDKFYPNNQLRIFAAEYEGEIISAVLLIGNKNVMHAWIAGRIAEFPKNIYQNELMWWKAIEWAFQSGIKCFDMCVVDEQNLPHISKFKLGFSKEIIPYYSLSKSSLFFKIANKLV